MISELQIPQVQPGVVATVRYDPNDPSKVVLEGVGMSTASAARPTGAAAIPMGATPRMSTGAKIGLAVGALGAFVGIGVAIVAVIVVMRVGSFASVHSSGTPSASSSSDAQ